MAGTRRWRNFLLEYDDSRVSVNIKVMAMRYGLETAAMAMQMRRSSVRVTWKGNVRD